MMEERFRSTMGASPFDWKINLAFVTFDRNQENPPNKDWSKEEYGRTLLLVGGKGMFYCSFCRGVLILYLT